MSEFQFERDEILSNLTLLEDHLQKFPCPWCMEKHASKIIGYAEEIAMGKEGDEQELLDLAEQVRDLRRKFQDMKGHNHVHAGHEHEDDDVKKCVKKLTLEGHSKEEARELCTGV